MASRDHGRKRPRRELRQVSPRFQLVLLVPGVVAAAVAVGLVGFLVPRLLRQAAEEGMIASLDLLVPQVSDRLDQESREMQRWIRDLTDPTGDRITIVGPDGTVEADSSIPWPEVRGMENHGKRPEIREALTTGTGASVRTSATTGVTYLYVARQVFDARGRSTVVRLARPLTQVDELRRELGWILALTLGGAGIAAVGAAFWFRHRLLYPFGRVVEGAERLAGHEAGRRLEEPEVPELAVLARSLNRLADRVDEQIAAKERERRQLREILDAMGEGILVTDREGAPVFSNRSLRRLFGLPEETATRDLLDLLRDAEIDRLIASARDGRKRTLELDWREKVLEIGARPVTDREGVLMVVRDATEASRVEAMRRDFVANLSHELKTPLAVIRGAAETLEDSRGRDPELLERFSHRIVEQCYRLEDLLKDLLTLARLENPDLPGAREPVDLGEVARRSVAQLQTLAERKDVRLEPEVGEGALIEGDERALERLLLNLLTNGIKYNREGGRVRLEVRREPDAVVLEVEDDGPGIPPSDLPRIFERFYRVEKGRGREEGGSGLGLAIVKHVAQSHGGRVDVESAVGEGSRFTVRLPRDG
ncbi:MAG: ATP-binding protein [Thermoanaerobaculia bacterium]|nr:ATP-binding protein [Thermoanaerobaculia bacterium]